MMKTGSRFAHILENFLENLSRLSFNEFKLATNKTLGYDKVICCVGMRVPPPPPGMMPVRMPMMRPPMRPPPGASYMPPPPSGRPPAPGSIHYPSQDPSRMGSIPKPGEEPPATSVE